MSLVTASLSVLTGLFLHSFSACKEKGKMCHLLVSLFIRINHFLKGPVQHVTEIHPLSPRLESTTYNSTMIKREKNFFNLAK